MIPAQPKHYFGNHWSMRVVFGDGRHLIVRHAALLAGWFLVIYGVCRAEGSLRLPTGNVGLLSDLFMFSLLACIVAVVVMSVRMVRTVEYVLDQLPRLLKEPAKSQVGLSTDIDRVREFVALRSPAGRRWYYALMVVMLGMVVFFQVVIPVWVPPASRAWSIWPDAYPASFAMAAAWSVYWGVLILGNAIWVSASSTFSIVWLVNKYAKSDELSTVPLAPDGCGGTSCIGDLALSNTMLAGCGMILVVAWLILYGVNLALVVAFLSYSTFLCLIFVVPCLSIHRVMRQAKQRELERLSRIAQKHHAEVPWEESLQASAADKDWWHAVGSDVHFRSDLERLHDRARQMPEWPFDSPTVGRVVSLVVVPGLVFVIQIVSQEALTTYVHRLVE